MTPRSEIIERSLRCLRRGGFSFLPVVGIYFSLRALRDFYAATTQIAERWNPGRRHLYAGMVLALLGLLVNVAAIAIIFVIVLKQIANA